MSDIVTFDTQEEAEATAMGRAANDPDNCWSVAPGPLYGFVVLCNGWIEGTEPDQ